MPETITTYYSFVPGTKARSPQVNTNFGNHRGTILPIDPNTAAAADLTYNLGSTEYYFNLAHFRTMNLRGVTTTANLVIGPDLTVTLGSYPIKIGTTERARIAHDKFNTNLAAGGSQEHVIGGATIGAIKSTGGFFKKNHIQSSVISVSVSGTSAFTITLSLVSLTTYGGPILMALNPPGDGSDSYVRSYSIDSHPRGYMNFYVDGSAVTQFRVGPETSGGGTSTAFNYPPSAFQFFLFNLAAGGHTFYITAQSETNTTVTTIDNCKLMVMEF